MYALSQSYVICLTISDSRPLIAGEGAKPLPKNIVFPGAAKDKIYDAPIIKEGCVLCYSDKC